MLIHRKIDIINDRNFLLQYHCEINYQCESDYGRVASYDTYRDKWLNTKNQVEEFLGALSKSMEDEKALD